MPGAHDKSGPVSTTADLDATVVNYSSPTVSSFPTPKHYPYDSPLPEDERKDLRTSMPSSPPTHTSSRYQTPPSLQHRRSSTHSGYLSRRQLFGSYSTPEPETSVIIQSKSMERIETRRRSGLSPLPDGSFSSPLANTQQETCRVLQIRSSTQSMREMQNESFSTSKLRSFRRSLRASTTIMRVRLPDTPRYEWVEVGTPDIENVDGSTRSGFASKSKATPTFEDNPGFDNTDKAVTSSAGGGIRDIPQAEMALREIPGRERPTKPVPAHKSGWASRTFRHRKPDDQISEALQFTPSDENLLEFGYAEPMSAESPEDIMTFLEARKEVGQQQVRRSLTGDVRKDEIISVGGERIDLQDGRDEESSSLVSNPQDSPPQPSRERSSQLEGEAMFTAPLETATEEPRRPQSTTVLLSLAPTMITLDQAPGAPVLAHAAHPIISLRAPLPPTQQLSISPIQSTFSWSPATPSQRQGLTFSEANAIVYGIVSFAALYIALVNLGDDIRAVDVAYGMTIAVMVGVAACLILGWVLGGRIKSMSGVILHAIG